MEIINIEKTKMVEDWDFNFVNGSAHSVTVDASAGDRAEYTPGDATACFHTAAKTSPYNPEMVLPAEDVYIPLMNVTCIRRRLRVVESELPDLSEDFLQMMQELEESNLKH